MRSTRQTMELDPDLIGGRVFYQPEQTCSLLTDEPWLGLVQSLCRDPRQESPAEFTQYIGTVLGQLALKRSEDFRGSLIVCSFAFHRQIRSAVPRDPRGWR